MQVVCPQPLIWSEIFKLLNRYWKEQLLCKGAPPPRPLILGGWTFSNDYDKNERWKETKNWARERSCVKLIPELSNEEAYMTHTFSSWIPYKFSNWNEEPRVRPEREKVAHYMKELFQVWPGIVDPEFGQKTKPLILTGKKLRRLVVLYQPEYLPPWGSWSNHLAKGSPSQFTLLRKQVNSLLAPHEVDHIDFTEDR